MATASHNTYLGTFVELGIVGFVIMLLAMASQLRIAWGGRHSGSLALYAIEASFVGFLVERVLVGYPLGQTPLDAIHRNGLGWTIGGRIPS
jgi:O-antigen ligase